MTVPILETERLWMRGFRNEDLDAYAEMSGDPEVMRYIGAGVPLSRHESWRSMAAMVGHWGRDRVISLIRAENAASIRVAGRLGERLTGEEQLPSSRALRYEVRRP